MQALLGNVLDRVITDAGYRGHNAPPKHKFRVYVAGHKRRAGIIFMRFIVTYFLAPIAK